MLLHCEFVLWLNAPRLLEEGKVLVRERWAWWRRWWSSAACVPLFPPWSSQFKFEIFLLLIK